MPSAKEGSLTRRNAGDGKTVRETVIKGPGRGAGGWAPGVCGDMQDAVELRMSGTTVMQSAGTHRCAMSNGISCALARSTRSVAK
jgi:hypothetical protein